MSPSGPRTRPKARRGSATRRAGFQTGTRFSGGSWLCRFLFFGKLQSHFPVAVGIVSPILAHFDEQKQMHGNAEDIGQLLAGFRPDRLDGGTALPQHDLALALALDKDGLLDPHRLVLALGPAVG